MTKLRIEFEQIGIGMHLICDDCDLIVGFGDSAEKDRQMFEFKKQHELECEGPLVFNLKTQKLETEGNS